MKERTPSMEASALAGTVRALADEAHGEWAAREDAGNDDAVLNFLRVELREAARRLEALAARLRHAVPPSRGVNWGEE